MLILTYERLGLGLSKAALARAADIDQSLLSKIESGRVRPYPTELRRLAIALGWHEREAHGLLDDADR